MLEKGSYTPVSDLSLQEGVALSTLYERGCFLCTDDAGNVGKGIVFRVFISARKYSAKIVMSIRLAVVEVGRNGTKTVLTSHEAMSRLQGPHQPVGGGLEAVHADVE